jgi:hypothetical protein
VAGPQLHHAKGHDPNVSHGILAKWLFESTTLKKALLAGSTPHPGSQHETEKFAKDGMIRHRADFYRIIDVGSNAEVASGRRDGTKW